jgi:acyl carrier protein
VITDTAEIERQVRDFLSTEVLDLDGGDLTADTALLAGLLDSFGLTSLLAFLEETYDVVIDNTEVVDENFGTIHDVALLVQRKRAAAG